MKDLTCIVVGGGFAGIHALKAIHKACHKGIGGRKLRLILIDMGSAHVRKVLLFRPAVSEEGITVPWEQVMPEGTRFIQGRVIGMDKESKQLTLEDSTGLEHKLEYDVLVVAIGSIVRQAAPEQGGISLTGLEAAERIRERWHANLKLAVKETNAQEKQRLMSAAVAGAGITGIETSAEMVHAMRTEAVKLGLDPKLIRVHLFNSQERLFLEGPAKVAHRLERYLTDLGVVLHHGRRVIKEELGLVHVNDGSPIPVGLTVWTLGLTPNPALLSLGLPVTMDGQIVVDESYRVKDAPGVYGIGDCAHVVDPANGAADRMTCKEAIPQATRLGGIVHADLIDAPAAKHKSVPEGYTVGLGPGHGLVWSRTWGMDIMITGKLAYKVKSFMWNYSSMVR
ncbi:FAD-dependent oxidoreductase [Paenibacillus sp. FSL W7-1279]|uniref:NAD(P)/FAD-dependent oxidoreductase n=1 Tax=Paenibacillus TaxID=44249 RepID=UPI001C7DA965|nr:FAD-dependent oxidoreductase [Paenibacillus lautus]MBX4148067.1 FAD-dependent oxidoreductase [Paenibacillus lautus]